MVFDHVSQIFCSQFDFRRKYAIRYMLYWESKTKRVLRPGEFYAVDDVTFTVNPGEVFWVVGTPGSGKSSLAKLMIGSLCPDVGRVRTNGVVRLVSSKFRWNGMMTVRENIQFIAMLLGLPKARLKGFVDEVLAFCGTGDIAEITAGNFSKKAFDNMTLAAFLFAPADVYIFDSKVSLGEGEMQQKFTAWMREHLVGKTFIVITTGTRFPFEFAPMHGLLLHEGKAEWQGPASGLVPAYRAMETRLATEKAKVTEKPSGLEDEDDLEEEETRTL
jgi:ABC-type polysaccharide/polyol phosphate transport system ATPase subunit